MRRLALLTLAVALPLWPSTSAAQIGGRIRSTITGTGTGQQQQAPAAVRPVVIPITAQVVTGYVNALKARDQEMRRLARENSPVGHYFAGKLLSDSVERRRNDYRAQVGPDWEREQQLNAALMRGDTSAASALPRLQASLNAQVDIPESDWNTQRAATAHMDTVMMQAAGLSAGEWAYVWDPMYRLVGMTAYSGVAEDSVVEEIARSMNLTPAEVRAGGARRIELARALVYRYRTDAQIAARAENSGRAHKTATPDANTYSG